jgi:hypothetical protein
MQDRLAYPGNNDEEVIPPSILCNHKPADEPCDDKEGSEDKGHRYTDEHDLTLPSVSTCVQDHGEVTSRHEAKNSARERMNMQLLLAFDYIEVLHQQEAFCHILRD